MTSLNPTMQIGKQVMEPLIKHKNYSKSEAKTCFRNIKFSRITTRNVLKLFHISFLVDKDKELLSQQLLAEPKVLIADEPTTALDVTMQAQILDLMKDLQKKIDTSIIFITHDLVLWQILQIE